MVGNPPIHDSNDQLHVELQSREVNLASRAASLARHSVASVLMCNLKGMKDIPVNENLFQFFLILSFTEFCGSLKQSCIHHKSGQ